MPEDLPADASPSDVFENVSVSLRVCVGTARPSLQELIELGPSVVLQLDRAVSDDVELYVGERLVGKGALEENSEAPGQLQVRVLKVGADL